MQQLRSKDSLRTVIRERYPSGRSWDLVWGRFVRQVALLQGQKVCRTEHCNDEISLIILKSNGDSHPDPNTTGCGWDILRTGCEYRPQ